MKPFGFLMVEHRLIEKMIILLNKETILMKEKNDINPEFIGNICDFFHNYVDLVHHGKEEKILFKKLKKKNLSKEHEKLLNQLLSEHAFARKTVKEIKSLKSKYLNGKKEELTSIISKINALAALYPKHIATEDRHFFIPCMNYFAEKEQNKMSEAFIEYDRTFMHEEYKKLIEMMQKW
jgi:hemerythrin-like domain-containing protein